MKRLGLLLLTTLLLVACNEEPETAPEEIEKEETVLAEEVSVEDEPTQEELNVQVREEAIELDFVKVNGGEVEWGTLVKGTGEVSVLYPEGIRGGDFMFSIKEGNNEYGVYHVINFNTEEIPLTEGQTVTIYGSLSGRDDSGMPIVTATIIE